MAPSSLSLVLLAAAYAAANDVQYITDLNLYSLLAPCAQSALSQNVQNQISSCGEGVTELQSCVCTKGNNYADISTAISSSLSYSCDSTATEDFTSANVVYSAYCTPDKTFDLPTPTANIISEMITDMPLFSSLAPCAQSGLSIAVGRMSDKCPEAENQYAPCICTRNENSAAISDVIKSSVSYNCENTHDITSAQAFFAAYCAMNDGTTALPAPSPPPGDMSYYITALDAYSSLDRCAQSALSSIVAYQTYNYCPQGPQALASCVCIKGGRFSSVSSSVTSEVKWDCSSTRQLDNVRSAMDVLDFYCDAAKGNVVATVTESIAQSYPTAQVATGSNTAGAQQTSVPSASGTGAAATTSGSSAAAGTSGTDGTTEQASAVSTAAIGGGVAGGVGGVILIGVLAWILIRRRRKAAATAVAASEAGSPTDAPGSPHFHTGKEEMLSPTAIELHEQTWKATPFEAPGNHQSPPTELQGAWGRGPAEASELHGRGAVEAHGVPIVSPSSKTKYEGMGWQSGPVDGYQELEAPHGTAR
ncbi:hypothetical protein D7B24_008967 [Verticillium nonalfalfae]|uniref:Extracellular membrane protein CFEM domain-containing protein n=1 Tax=Verticillium nonalfalfae TaxID=1051616 RepID=A0A3M9Y4A0_9PEZI|nr:uncharacterized protein D7B24_008967 [Verticillium nonalfalfae]RNJ55101.1 hypothetical protein D7B24_008967 [Verticillium nonalfalfae]